LHHLAPGAQNLSGLKHSTRPPERTEIKTIYCNYLCWLLRGKCRCRDGTCACRGCCTSGWQDQQTGKSRPGIRELRWPAISSSLTSNRRASRFAPTSSRLPRLPPTSSPLTSLRSADGASPAPTRFPWRIGTASLEASFGGKASSVVMWGSPTLPYTSVLTSAQLSPLESVSSKGFGASTLSQSNATFPLRECFLETNR